MKAQRLFAWSRLNDPMDNQHARHTAGLDFASLTAQTFVVFILTQAFSLAVSVIVARMLGPTGKGVVAVLILYPTLLFTVGHLSLFRALTVHVGLKQYSLESYCGSLLFFIGLVSFFLTVGFMAVFVYFPRFFSENLPFDLILLSLLLVPFFLLIQLFASLLQTQNKVGLMNIVSLAQSVFTLAILLVGFIFVKKGISVVVLAYVAANMLAAMTAVFFVRKLAPGPWALDFSLLKRLVADGFKLHLGVIAVFLYLKIDQLMLDHYRSFLAVGLYSVAVSLTDLLQLIPLAIQNVFYAKIATQLNNKTQLDQKTLVVYKHNFILLSALGLFLVLAARPAIDLFFGKAFHNAFWYFLLLGPGAFFLYLNNVLINYLVAMRRFLLVSSIAVAGAFLNIILNIIFIPRYDAAGAAVASTITYVCVGVFVIVAFLKVSKCGFAVFMKNFKVNPGDLDIYFLFFNRLLQWRGR